MNREFYRSVTLYVISVVYGELNCEPYRCVLTWVVQENLTVGVTDCFNSCHELWGESRNFVSIHLASLLCTVMADSMTTEWQQLFLEFTCFQVILIFSVVTKYLYFDTFPNDFSTVLYIVVVSFYILLTKSDLIRVPPYIPDLVPSNSRLLVMDDVLEFVFRYRRK
jgi:hypothetical protein